MRPDVHDPAGGIPARSRWLPAALLALATAAALLGLQGCGQKDPAGVSNGSIAVATADSTGAPVTGAAIFLDGVATSRVTPDTLRGVSVGRHVITVALDCYAISPLRDTVDVVQDHLASSAFVAQAGVTVGSILVTSNQPGGLIYLDGVPTGKNEPDTLKGVCVGSHKVWAGHLGCTTTPDTATVNVTQGNLATATFTDGPLDQAAHRTVLLEHFTNWQCQPCLQTEPVIDAIYGDLDRSTVALITYHENVASQNDPFYLANITENLSRKTYYGVTASPWVALDATVFDPAAMGLGWSNPTIEGVLRDSIQARAAASPSMTITVQAVRIGDNYRVRAGITAHQDFTGQALRLHLVVVEKEPHIPPPGGAGGVTVYPWSMRDMIPDATGRSLTIASGQNITLEYLVPFAAAWDPDQVGAVAFVQRDDGTKVVVQTGSTF